jgi:hypothetical protein
MLTRGWGLPLARVASLESAGKYLADGSTDIIQDIEYEVCLTVPPWWSNRERAKFADALTDVDHGGVQLICDVTASLTYFLSKSKSHSLEPHDIFAHCHMEEQITVRAASPPLVEMLYVLDTLSLLEC